MESVPAHIARMIALLGLPPKELLQRGQFSDMFFDEDGELLGSTQKMMLLTLSRELYEGRQGGRYVFRG
jgi:serine/threonine-protein kinase SRPK3